jgi:hypothetical protein
MATLQESLNDWTDWDVAAFALGIALGVFEAGTFHRHKGVFWSNNNLGNGLHAALGALGDAGVLERRDEPDDQYRWAS